MPSADITSPGGTADSAAHDKATVLMGSRTEADADGRAARRHDGCVDSDQAPGAVKQGAATVCTAQQH
jgi:hypothetical protein